MRGGEGREKSVYTAPLTTYQLATLGKGEQLGKVGGGRGRGEANIIIV